MIVNRSLAVFLLSVAFHLSTQVAAVAQPVQNQAGGEPTAVLEADDASATNETVVPEADLPGDIDGGNDADAFISAIDLLPGSTSGVIRIPELPAFCEAWKQTQIGQLFGAPEMQPFLDAQRERASTYLATLDRKIGLKPEDLYAIASGEVVLASMSFEEDKRRPYSLCIVADIRGLKKEAEDAAEQIDAELKAGGATRKDVPHGDETIRVYRTKPKPGQLKIDEIALTWNDQRFIASDRTAVVKDLLNAASRKADQKAFSARESFQQVIADSTQAIIDAKERDATKAIEWYAEPFAMGRILREAFEYDRRDDLDVIELLERQGFGVIEAVGGVGIVAGDRFDLLHRGIILAPGKLTKAARMLQAKNASRSPLPGWLSADSGAFYRLNWDLESAFWSAESLVNDALGEDLFRPMIDGIRDDPEGPQIDIAKDFLPNLDDEVILVTDNTMPAGPESDRMLVALRIKNADVVAKVIEKAMEVEPDAIKLDLPDLDVWRVERGEGDTDDIDAQLAALGFEDNIDEDEAAPLLNHWAIAVVRGANADDPDYLMFSSHAELLVKLGKRVRSGESGDGMDSTEATKQVISAMDDLKAEDVTFDSVVHPAIALRARYELLRKGELKDSDSVIANLLKRIVEEDEEGEADPIQAGLLPDFQKIQTYFKSSGAFWQKTDSGWNMTGFMMAE